MITNRDKTWYSLALKVAADSACYDRHGCVIVRAGSVLALATNRVVVSHPVSARYYKQALHAEQRAILRAKDSDGATLYSARLHVNPISAPCEMCQMLIGEAGISKIVFHDGKKLCKIGAGL